MPRWLILLAWTWRFPPKFFVSPIRHSTIFPDRSLRSIRLYQSWAVRNLALSFSFLSMKGGKKTRFNFNQFWERSLAGAAAAKLIAEQFPDIDIDELFVSGLLQNIGHLIFSCTIPDKYEEILCNTSDLTEIDAENAEKALVGITHSHAGYEVAKNWGLPELHLDVIRFHHSPTAYVGNDEQIIRIIKIVFLSGTLASIFYDSKPEIAHKQFRKEAISLFLVENKITDDEESYRESFTEITYRIQTGRAVAT